jgi:O-antigen/teichoic acid export membrane protein
LKSDFLKSSSWSFTAVAFRALGGLTINKLFSIYLGPAGLTLLSHFQNLTALFTILPSEGVNRGVMKYWSDPQLTEKEKKAVFRSGLWVTLTIYLLTFLGLYVWQGDFFFDRFIQDLSVAQFLIVFIPAVLFMLLSGYLNSVILAMRRVRAYAIINIIGLFLLVAVVYWGIQTENQDRALLSFAVGYGLMFFCALVYVLIHNKKFGLSVGRPNKRALGRIFRFLAMAVSAIIFGRLLDFVIRDYVIDLYGLERTGLWQAVAKMSTSYLLVFTGTVGVVYYPKMASLIHDHRALRAYVLKVMGFVAVVSVVALGVYWLNKDFVLKVFFANGFEKGSYLVKYQVVGDFFSILSYLLAYLLSARVETIKYIFAQLFSAVIYVLFIALFIEHYNLEALTLAYMFRYIGFFFLLIWMNRRSLFR